MQQNIVLSIQDRLQQLPKSERKIAEGLILLVSLALAHSLK